MPYGLIIKAMSYGFFFRARDEEGNFFPADNAFHEALSADFESTLIKILLLDPLKERKIMPELKKLFILLKNDNEK